MADEEHSALTGSDLHEPKGIVGAPANRVYVSDGATSGSWTTVGNAVLAPEAKAFTGSLLHVQDQKTSGTVSQSITSGDWRTRTLNTVVTNEITGASLASNQITLPVGTYYIEADAIAGLATAQQQLRIRNITDSTTTLTGLNAYNNNSGGYASTPVKVRGRFTLAGTKILELQHRVTVSVGGVFASSYGTEVYADLVIWKVG